MNKLKIHILVVAIISGLISTHVAAQSVSNMAISPGANFYVYGNDTVSVWGNLNNAGSLSLQANSTVRFFGDSLNNITTSSLQGGGTMEYVGLRPAPYYKDTVQYSTGGVNIGNVLTNNTRGIWFTNALTVSNTLTLVHGTITADTVNITSPATSAISGYITNPSNASYGSSPYINGTLIRAMTGTGTYGFPVGTTSNYQLLTFNENGLTGTSNIAVKFVTGNTGCTTPNPDSLNVNGTRIQTLLDGGYWRTQPNAEPTGGTYDAYVNERGYTAYPGSPYQMCLIKRTDCSGNWQSLGTHSNNTQSFNNGTATSARTGLTGFSDFGIGWGDAPLPVELLSFNAMAVNNSLVHTNWEAATQHSNRLFNIQRSADGRVFATIGEVNGCGTCNDTRNYAFNDIHPLQGVSYYRLQLVGENGTLSYSDIRTVNIGTSYRLMANIFPNPAVGLTSLEIISPNKTDAIVSICDITGKTVLTQNVSISSGVNHYSMDIQPLAVGLYMINVVAKDLGRVSNIRLVKVN